MKKYPTVWLSILLTLTMSTMLADTTVKILHIQDNPKFLEVWKSPYLQIVYDQFLGANVGRVVNDVSADLAADATTPEEAAQTVEEAWQSEK